MYNTLRTKYVDAIPSWTCTASQQNTQACPLHTSLGKQNKKNMVKWCLAVSRVLTLYVFILLGYLDSLNIINHWTFFDL